MFGLAAGLAAATMSCAAEDTMPVASATGEESSVNDGDDHDADAVTYAGPDDASITDPGETFTTDPTTTTSPDPTDADAVTYAGPDESSGTSETTDTETETTGTGTDTTSSGTEESSTGSSGTGDTDPNG
jgi:hypothetical protein